MWKKNGIWIVVLIAAVAFIGRYWYMLPAFSSGEEAIDFKVNEEAQLSDLRGKYVLLDFWGSWCRPCRQENPQLRALYNKFHDQGLEIVGIGIEKDKENWANVIKKDQLIWSYQVLDLATNLRFFDSPIATLYGVKQVPTKYLIDDKGIIMGVNPSFEQLDQLLTERLTK